MHIVRRHKCFFVICMGCINAFAWTMTNIQSSNSQKRWESHIDMLEDEITGPLVKVVSNIKTHSITKISEIVSRFFVAVWIILAIKYFFDHITLTIHKLGDIDVEIWLSSLITIYFSGAMRFGYGRRKYTFHPIQFYKRKFQKT